MAQSKTGLDALTPVDGLQVKLTGGVLSVTLDRPDSLNSLTPEVLAGVADAFEAAAADPRVRVVRLGGNGRGFCSGAGIGKVGEFEEQGNWYTGGVPRNLFFVWLYGVDNPLNPQPPLSKSHCALCAAPPAEAHWRGWAMPWCAIAR